MVAIDADGDNLSFEGLGYDRSHPLWVGHVMSAAPARRADHLQNMFAVTVGANASALELRNALFTAATTNAAGELERTIALTGGLDGAEPVAANYSLALGELAGLEDISIVAAPGSSAYAEAQAINNLLISHAESRRAYRIAVLDLPRDQTPGQARTLRGLIDSRYAAGTTLGGGAQPAGTPRPRGHPRELALPPSGFVSGIYARNDVERGVWKAPANEVVRGALRFELDINFAQQEMLNPIGVNCLRYLSGPRLPRVGARLASSDPEWKYGTCGATSTIWNRRSTAAPSGRCSSPTANGCGPTCGRRSRLPLQRVAQRRAARHQDRGSLFRALRPQHHDPERPRQRSAGLPDRRGGDQSRPNS